MTNTDKLERLENEAEAIMQTALDGDDDLMLAIFDSIYTNARQLENIAAVLRQALEPKNGTDEAKALYNAMFDSVMGKEHEGFL